MTDQQPLYPSINELGAKFGEQLAQGHGLIITLEKQLTAQALTIQTMTKHEAGLFDDIQDLEAKIAEFTQQEYDFIDHIQELEVELAELKKSLETMINEPYRETEQSAMSPEAAKIAEGGRAAIREK